MKHPSATVRVLGRAQPDALPLRQPVGANGATAHGHLLLASSDVAWLRQLRHLLLGFGAKRIDAVEDAVALEKTLTEQAPDVLLLDLSTGTFSLDSVWAVRTLSPSTRTILLASLPDDGEAVRALREGAAGYGPRETAPDLLLAAIGLVRQGGIWVAQRIILRMIERFTSRPGAGMRGDRERLRGLTARECQIAELTASGASNKEIADRLHVRERTVKAHLSNIFQKLGVSSRLQVASYFWTRSTVQ